jgi:predicted MFS family arabinose efflux permease
MQDGFHAYKGFHADPRSARVNTTQRRHAKLSLRRSRSVGAVLFMTLCVRVMIASEFMPVSLLTPVAAEVSITEAHTGEDCGVRRVRRPHEFVNSGATARFGRRPVLLSLTVVTMLSGVFVAAAPTFATFMVGHAVLGVAGRRVLIHVNSNPLRLVSAERVSGALVVLNGGNVLAPTVAAPFGSYADSLIGMRGAFLSVVPFGAGNAAVAGREPAGDPSRPKCRLEQRARSAALSASRTRHDGHELLFMSQFALFTYLRPYLETMTTVEISMLSLLLLVIGLAGLLGNSLLARCLGLVSTPASVAWSA